VATAVATVDIEAIASSLAWDELFRVGEFIAKTSGQRFAPVLAFDIADAIRHFGSVEKDISEALTQMLGWSDIEHKKADPECDNA